MYSGESGTYRALMILRACNFPLLYYMLHFMVICHLMVTLSPMPLTCWCGRGVIPDTKWCLLLDMVNGMCFSMLLRKESESNLVWMVSALRQVAVKQDNLSVSVILYLEVLVAIIECL